MKKVNVTSVLLAAVTLIFFGCQKEVPPSVTVSNDSKTDNTSIDSIRYKEAKRKEAVIIATLKGSLPR